MAIRLKQIQAENIEDAEKQGWEFLETKVVKGIWEYTISENPSSYRIYNTETHKRD